jgi:hypothetical protein
MGIEKQNKQEAVTQENTSEKKSAEPVTAENAIETVQNATHKATEAHHTITEKVGAILHKLQDAQDTFLQNPQLLLRAVTDLQMTFDTISSTVTEKQELPLMASVEKKLEETRTTGVKKAEKAVRDVVDTLEFPGGISIAVEYSAGSTMANGSSSKLHYGRISGGPKDSRDHETIDAYVLPGGKGEAVYLADLGDENKLVFGFEGGKESEVQDLLTAHNTKSTVPAIREMTLDEAKQWMYG